jgi:signal transduction histidine kinase
LESYCSEFSKLTGIETKLHAGDFSKEVPPPIALCLFRIAQEALQNVAKHSGSKQANLRLSKSNGRIRLVISDQGSGLPPERASTHPGLGLISMRERARLVDGLFFIDSVPGHGTTITVSIPLVGKAAAATDL